MKNAVEKVRLSTEESEMVAGGASFTTLNLAAVKQPNLAVYAQVAPTSLGSLKPVATDFSALQPVSPSLSSLKSLAGRF